MSVANGSHCHATIRMMAKSGMSANQSMGARPSDVAMNASNPDTGCIRRFFQTRALTVGMTKKGAMTIRRTMLRPTITWSSRRAISVPSAIVIASTDPTSTRVLCREARNAGSVRK